jgi:NDP-sugar pyrophosphorylase family protein
MLARGLRQIPVVDSAGRLAGLHLLHEMLSKRARENWAVVMAGGKGTRLRPITEAVPKPMIPVAGRPILERLVLHLVSHGINRIFLSVNYLGHVIEEHFGDGRRFGCQIEYLREAQPLGTGGSLALLPQRPAKPFLVLNGDLVTQVDVGAMLDEHERCGNAITVGLRQYTHTIPYGCVQIGERGIEGFEEKPTVMRMVNAGIYAFEPQQLDRIPRGTEFPITELIEGSLKSKERVGAFELAGDWIDVGQWDQLKRARSGAD